MTDPVKALHALETAESAVAAAQQKVDEAGAAFRAELEAAGWRRLVGAFSSNSVEVYENQDGEICNLATLRDRIKENNK